MIVPTCSAMAIPNVWHSTKKGIESMNGKSAIVSFVILLGACAATPKYDYVKEGASDHEKTNVMSECQYQIRLNKTPSAEVPELLSLCMQGKGFRLKRTN
jgi:hypothetical protein